MRVRRAAAPHDGLRDVLLHVVAAAQQQRYEDRLTAAEVVQGPREEGFVELDVAEPDVQPRPQLPHPVQEFRHRVQRPRVPAAVRDGDEGGGGGDQRAHVALRGLLRGAVHGPSGSVQGDEAELGA